MWRIKHQIKHYEILRRYFMNNRLERNTMGVEVKTGRVDQACARYGVGRNTMRSIAEQAGAVRRIGRNYLIDFKDVDKYLDSLSGDR